MGSAMKTSLLADVGFLVGVAVVSMASEDGFCRRAKGKEWSPRSGRGSPTPARILQRMHKTVNHLSCSL